MRESNKMTTVRQPQQRNRPARQNVRFDAARILEEILDERLDSNLKHNHKVRRQKTGPEVKKETNRIHGSDNSVTRSQTLPTNYREAVKNVVKQNEIEALLDKTDLDHKLQDGGLNDTGSTADTEDNLSLVAEKRKKKGFLKRAKERILFTFRRDQKGGPGKDKENNNLDTKKSKAQNGEIKNKSKNVKKQNRDDKVADQNQDNGHNNKNGHGNTQIPVVKKEKGKFWSSFRKSKKRQQVTEDECDRTLTLSFNGVNTDHTNLPAQTNDQQSAKEKKNVTPDPHSHHQSSDPPRSAGGSLPGTDNVLPSIPAFDHTPTSSTDTNNIYDKTSAHSSDIPVPENVNQPRVVNVIRSQTSVLDCPGDDIDFIDASDSESTDKFDLKSHDDLAKHVHNAGFRFSDTNVEFGDSVHSLKTGDPRLIHIADLTAALNAKNVFPLSDVDHDGYDVFDGRSFTQDAWDDDQVDQEIAASQDELDQQATDPGRDAMYSAVAQKLIDMADSYSLSGSDEKSGQSPPESQSLKSLSDLEKEIIECLRSVGDGATKQIKEDIYARFRSTMQNSLGELSWHHVAFSFYAFKEVVSFLGKTSQEAQHIKDFTLQYVNDALVPWITAQGGFDSLVNSDESDFGVD